MASGPITSWQIDGETTEIVTAFISLGSKVTADGGCSHEIKRPLLLGRKTMTNLDSILRSKGVTLLTKVCIVKAMVFLVVILQGGSQFVDPMLKTVSLTCFYYNHTQWPDWRTLPLLLVCK